MDSMVIGVDYSINGPGMTIWVGDLENDVLSLDEFVSVYANEKTKTNYLSEHCMGFPLKYKYTRGPTEKAKVCADIFMAMSSIFKDSIMTDNVYVFFENYAFGGNNLSLLAEHCAALKQEFFSMYFYNLFGIAPASVKKLLAKDKKVKGQESKEEVHKGVAELFGLESLEEWFGKQKGSEGFYDVTDSMAVSIFGIYWLKVKNQNAELKWNSDKLLTNEEIKYLQKYEPDIL